MHQTEEPGRYSAFGGKRHMYILDLPVKDHRIFYCEGQLGGKAIRMAKLVGRNPDMSLEALEEFKKFTERKGLPQDIIIMPVQTGKRTTLPRFPVSTLHVPLSPMSLPVSPTDSSCPTVPFKSLCVPHDLPRPFPCPPPWGRHQRCVVSQGHKGPTPGLCYWCQSCSLMGSGPLARVSSHC
ncbi:uncharacterized protein [Equus przewalskii]|uniref:Uncharacterized protein isoform X1 n=1 Tax=Equus przewalskii TaxID=9798 RepID=A0ABM4K6B7_EQUPR